MYARQLILIDIFALYRPTYINNNLIIAFFTQRKNLNVNKIET